MDTIQTTEMDLALDLARVLYEHDGFLPQEEVLAAFPDVSREELTRAREEIGAEMIRSTDTGQWWLVAGDAAKPEPTARAYDLPELLDEKPPVLPDGRFRLEILNGEVEYATVGPCILVTYKVLSGKYAGETFEGYYVLTNEGDGGREPGA